ncbi:hypothetical protein PV682_33410 [Streptomyces niveiscabiei]|uniref:hypothetical protein n=1 Tax=Streptomyces niveiscabiei TaxID=164115 RepID=UPI00299FB19E|nr:hypothetical protein [Streptomyces niveiscabiei]MDX3386318.1 hypothetical protein [Streptomyces niveiscabiei]
MSLPDIAALIAGGRDDQDWHTFAERRLADCAEQLTRLNRARTYLRHLRTCPSTHPVEREHRISGLEPQVDDQQVSAVAAVLVAWMGVGDDQTVQRLAEARHRAVHGVHLAVQ